LGIVTLPDFTINFGWVRLELSSDTSFLIVKSYAYDTIPDECIAVHDPPSLTTSVNTLEPELEIFPNPVSDELFISELTGRFYDLQVMIYDLAGRVVFAQKNLYPTTPLMWHFCRKDCTCCNSKARAAPLYENLK
jgi:hypothetical protein